MLHFSIQSDLSELIKGINQSKAAFKSLGDAAIKTGATIDKVIEEDLSENIIIQKQVIQNYEKSLTDLDKQIKAMAPGLAQLAVKGDREKLIKEIELEKESLIELSQVQSNYGESAVSMRTQMYNLRQNLAELKEGTIEYRQALEQLGRDQDKYQDIQRQGRIMADDFKYFNATREAVQGLSGALSAGVGIASLFGAKNEDLTKIQTRLQSLMAISLDIQQAMAVANKDSYTQQLLLVTAKRMDAAVTGLLSKTMIALGISTKVATIAARSLMIILTGGLILAITAVVLVIDKLITKNKQQKESLEVAKKAQEDFNKSVANNAADTILKLRLLQQQYAALGDDMQAKNKFIKENKKSFEELGVSIKSVSDLENLLINNTNAYISSVMAKAKADAYAELAKEKIKESIAIGDRTTYKKAYKYITTEKTTNTANSGFAVPERVLDEEENAKRKEKAIQEHLAKKKVLEDEANAYLMKGAMEAAKAIEELKKSGLKEINNEDNDSLKKIEQLKKEIIKQENDIKQEINKLRRSSEEESTKGTKQEIENRYKYFEEDLEEKELKYIELNKKANISSPDMSAFDNLRKQRFKDKENELKIFDLEKTREDLSKFENLSQKYIEKYNELENLKKVSANPTTRKQNGFDADETNALIKQSEQELNLLSQNLILNNTELQAFLSLVIEMGIKETADKLSVLQVELQALMLKSGGGDSKIPQLQSKIKILEQQLSVTQKDAKAKTEDKSAGGNWKVAYDILGKVNKTIIETVDGFDSIDDQTKKAIKTVSFFATSTMQMIDGIDKLVNFSAEGLSKTSEAATTSMIAIEKASIILTVISTAFQIVMKIIDLVKSNAAKEAAKKVEIIEKKIEALDNEYEKLQKSIERAYGSDASKLIQQGNELLLQQKEQLKLLLAQEEAKARSADKSKDREEAEKNAAKYKEQIDEITEKMEENTEKMTDVIFGEDVKSAIDRFADYYIASFGKSNEEIKKGQKKFVRDMIQAMILQIVKEGMGPKMEELRKMMIEYAADGISEAEESAIDNFIEQLYNETDKKMTNYERWMGDDESSREAESKGIASASQESVDENNALLTTMVGHTRELIDHQRLITPVIQSIGNDLSIAVGTIHGIKEDTGEIRRDISSVKRSIEDIRDNGINIKY